MHMSDEQPTSWRDRFFGGPGREPERAEGESGSEADPHSQHSAELAPDSAEAAATSVTEHDAHQPLVEHEPEADTAALDTHDTGAAPRHAADASDDRVVDSIAPTVIAPSTLRGPSHSAAHPDDMARTDSARSDSARGADERHGEAATSSLEQAAESAADEPPALVEPRRPAFGLRRHTEEAPVGDGTAGTTGAAGLAAAAGATAGTGASARTEREFVEPEPTQAIEHRGTDDEATRVIETRDDATATRVLETPAVEEPTRRFGIIRDEVPASSIPVDDETARAAAGGTPIVLVEEPMPPRRKGARGVGFAVALLATLVFGLVFAAAFFAVGYLFDRRFDAVETLETLWLRPAYLLPVVVFFLAYWIVTLVVNRAGWWAHVLGAFLVALVVYLAHIGGAYMEAQGGWESYTALPGIDAEALGQLLLAPLSVLAFVIAREVPIWVGGIVSRRGRKAREYNRQALDDFNAENAERLAAYERARG
jgi:hypothetical protein